jgi:polyisoprenyl-phosphate glycosyltransferase
MTPASMASPVLSIVAPAFNEASNLAAFVATIVPVLESIGETFEIVFVNDGSRDDTFGMLAAAASQDARIKVVSLARNFGKDIALSAGLAHATGQAVIPIDCDLQHPPELIREFVAKWREGFDMVVGVRSKRDEEGWLRRMASRTYYRAMRWVTTVEIPPNAGDFRLIDRKIIDVITAMPERHRFMKGIFAWPGFKVSAVEFQANVRANDRSRWSFFKLWRFALDGLFSFSTAPLKVWTYVGVVAAVGAFIYLIITLSQAVLFGIDVPGYASLLIVMLFFNGMLLISNGIQGEYIGRIFEEVKARPLYVVGAKLGFDEEVIEKSASAGLQSRRDAS